MSDHDRSTEPGSANRVLMKGNVALVHGAIAGGCQCYFGYPITPQNEVPEYMSALLPKAGGVFLQAESEVAAINMVYGAAAAGVRAMTSSSSPGISLMQEGITYMVGAELPGVIVNVVRGGPGLGGIAAAQSDYFQAVKGGGHGDYHTPVLAPWSVQEMHDLVRDAFDVADRYRVPVIVLADAVLGQMMEPMTLDDEPIAKPPPKPWATNGARGRPKNIINSLYIDPDVLEQVNLRLDARFREATAREIRCEAYSTDDADLVLVAYGTAARVSWTAMEMARAAGLRVGLLRPITLSPFPAPALAELAGRVRGFLVVELSMGQMVEDVRLAVEGRVPVSFFGRTGGVVCTPAEVFARIKELV